MLAGQEAGTKFQEVQSQMHHLLMAIKQPLKKGLQLLSETCLQLHIETCHYVVQSFTSSAISFENVRHQRLSLLRAMGQEPLRLLYNSRVPPHWQ
jgi:hypothetical protein